MSINTLEKEHIYAIHEESIENFGGRSGYFSHTDGMIESILNQQYSSFGYDKYPSIFDKASMLMYFFAKNHCFADGNKRVSLYCLYMFLAINSYELTLDDEEAKQLILEVAESNYRNVQIDRFIFKKSKYIEENSVYI